MISRFSVLKNTLGELFKDVLPILEKFAPSFGAVLGGPPGFAAGFAIPLLAHAFGANPHDTTDIVAKIKAFAAPGQESALRQIENQYGPIIASLLDNLGSLTSAKINVELSWGNEPAAGAA